MLPPEAVHVTAVLVVLLAVAVNPCVPFGGRATAFGVIVRLIEELAGAGAAAVGVAA